MKAYGKVPFIKSLQRTMCKHIVNIYVGDETEPVAYMDLPLKPEPKKINGRVKNIYDVRILPGLHALRFFLREKPAAKLRPKRKVPEADIQLPEEFLSTVEELMADGNEDILIAYTARLKDFLQQDGRRSPTHWVFVDEHGGSQNWESGAGGSNSEQVFAYVTPHEPALRLGGHSKRAKRVPGGTQLFIRFCELPESKGFVGTVRELTKAIQQRFPVDYEKIVSEREQESGKKVNGILHAQAFKNVRVYTERVKPVTVAGKRGACYKVI